ncbi:MAG: hypothetical protein IT539_12485 [Bradyrhizobiaceae bacterium]|nr:hypothetical protein [Bradyrhizobiaceae bacterium]
MAYNCVTFRIADRTVGGRTYDERRALLIENARAEKLGYWEETTSFLLVESNVSTEDFTRRTCKGLSAADDLVLVFDQHDQTAFYFGPFKHVDVLKSFFPKLKKLP